MPSMLKEALEWLNPAEQAREVAGQLTDPGARKAVLELAESFGRLARAAATPAVLRRREWSRSGIAVTMPVGGLAKPDALGVGCEAFLKKLTILPIDMNGYILSQKAARQAANSTITARELVRDKAGWIHA
jgi:hypothetical protein